jgi:hypothetical protein
MRDSEWRGVILEALYNQRRKDLVNLDDDLGGLPVPQSATESILRQLVKKGLVERPIHTERASRKLIYCSAYCRDDWSSSATSASVILFQTLNAEKCVHIFFLRACEAKRPRMPLRLPVASELRCRPLRCSLNSLLHQSIFKLEEVPTPTAPPTDCRSGGRSILGD